MAARAAAPVIDVVAAARAAVEDLEREKAERQRREEAAPHVKRASQRVATCEIHLANAQRAFETDNANLAAIALACDALSKAPDLARIEVEVSGGLNRTDTFSGAAVAAMLAKMRLVAERSAACGAVERAEKELAQARADLESIARKFAA